ncbi:TRAP transporter large permease subunit [Aurantimonas sp. MSK8Z-1]|uniref:TRAP transporter large permease n=1 Tax=Mangrovibrevibacter kandeliae TaxID=2968473 RepID=UPI0021182261|nr:TRAP transporter large permease subunit [Aurantimonas sp. MSK8Z-1]MCW4113609.1 TRAP transporter large permease subunit [Aurantimonas sp. MSK8Z-1]
MIELIAHNLAPIMFASLVIFLLLGYPVAFSLAANGLLFFVIGVELTPYSGGEINLFWPLLNALPDNFYGSRVMSNDTLLAIPFFTFMGLILERSGMAEDLLDTIGQLFGPVRGGLAYAVVFVGALLAATTGVVAASVIAMGLISLPIMLRYGYDRRVATGIIAASGTLAQIIPPSLVLIVLADQLGRSVGDMYSAAIVPGIVLTSLYVGYIFLVSMFRKDSAPAIPVAARTLGSGVLSLFVALAVAVGLSYAATLWFEPRVPQAAGIWGAVFGVLVVYAAAVANRVFNLKIMSYLAQQVIIVMIPPLALIFLVLGTIFLGVATPTEGGAMGAVGALILAFAKRRFSYDLLVQAMEATTKLSAFVIFILIGARVFSLTFYGVNGHLWVEELLTSVPGGETGFLIVVNILVFVLAFFLDFFELAFIIVPLLGPIADKLGIDLVWFGILLAINMQTSFMHPPFGFALFYLRSVAPRGSYIDKVTGKRTEGITTGQIYWGSVPFVIIQVIMVGLTILFPGMALRYKSPAPVTPPSQQLVLPPLSGGGQGGAGSNQFGLPPLGFPQQGGGSGAGGNNPLGLPPLGLPQQQPPASSAGASSAAPQENNPLGLPPLGLPPASPNPIATPLPNFGGTDAGPQTTPGNGSAPVPDPATDLSQPPKFN